MAQARETPRSPRGFLVDTNVLVSKKLCALRGLPGPLYVTPVVVLEYMNWAIASRNRMLAKRMHERAKGYERLIGLLPSLLEALGVELIDQGLDAEALREAARLITERSVDPGDALNAVTAKRHGLGVVTGDRDWERLRDYAAQIIWLDEL